MLNDNQILIIKHTVREVFLNMSLIFILTIPLIIFFGIGIIAMIIAILRRKQFKVNVIFMSISIIILTSSSYFIFLSIFPNFMLIYNTINLILKIINTILGG